MGLAQARQPLSTRSHYFEVEIVDPGEKCYIALGLARKVRAVVGKRMFLFARSLGSLQVCCLGAASAMVPSYATGSCVGIMRADRVGKRHSIGPAHLVVSPEC